MIALPAGVDGSFVLRAAFRYALGQPTYTASATVRWLESNLEEIPAKDLRLISDDIDAAERRRQLGMAMDVAAWLRLREKIEEHLRCA